MLLTNFTKQPPYANPKLNIFFFGLGTLWFDGKNESAEIGFIEVAKTTHPLTMEICQNGRLIYSEEVPKNKTIFINGNKGNRGTGNQYHSPDHPDEDDPDKPDEDFRWMIDMDSVHKQPLEFCPNPDFFSRFKISVGDAIFYTRHKSQSNAVLMNSNRQPVRPPSRVGQVIGISSAMSGSEVTIEGSQNLLPDTNSNYTVIIRYHCANESDLHLVNSDFYCIYDVISLDENLSRHTLEYEDEETPWISTCELTKMTAHSQNIASIFARNDSLTLTHMNEISSQLSYINHRLNCEITCQNVIFGKYSRTVN